MIFMYIVHCAVVYEYGMTVYISWKIVGLLCNGDESHTLLPIELSQSRGFKPRHGHRFFDSLISVTVCIGCPNKSIASVASACSFFVVFVFVVPETAATLVMDKNELVYLKAYRESSCGTVHTTVEYSELK